MYFTSIVYGQIKQIFGSNNFKGVLGGQCEVIDYFGDQVCVAGGCVDLTH